MGVEEIVREYEQIIRSIDSIQRSASVALKEFSKACSLRVSYVRENNIVCGAKLRADYKPGSSNAVIKNHLQPFRDRVNSLSSRLNDCYSMIGSLVESNCVVSRFDIVVNSSGETVDSTRIFIFGYRNKNFGVVVTKDVISEPVELGCLSSSPSGRTYHVGCRNPFIPLDFYVSYAINKVAKKQTVNENV